MIHKTTKEEQKVKIKFSDYSAEYGKDYYAKLDDSIFAKKIEASPDSVPLFYMFDGDWVFNTQINNSDKDAFAAE